MAIVVHIFAMHRLLLLFFLLVAVMGSAVSIPLFLCNSHPQSLNQCIGSDGWLDAKAFLSYCHCKHDKMALNIHQAILKRRAVEDNVDDGPKKKRTQSCKAKNLKIFDASGNQVLANPKLSPWYLLYVNALQGNLCKKKFHKKFCHRFCLPYANYLELLKDLSDLGKFTCWESTDAVGKPLSPLSIMLLGVLQCLGLGWMFDDLEEATLVSEETHRQFFHCFLDYSSTVLFKEQVVSPASAHAASGHMHEMEQAGMHGACGSMDGICSMRRSH